MGVQWSRDKAVSNTVLQRFTFYRGDKNVNSNDLYRMLCAVAEVYKREANIAWENQRMLFRGGDIMYNKAFENKLFRDHIKDIFQISCKCKEGWANVSINDGILLLRPIGRVSPDGGSHDRCTSILCSIVSRCGTYAGILKNWQGDTVIRIMIKA